MKFAVCPSLVGMQHTSLLQAEQLCLCLERQPPSLHNLGLPPPPLRGFCLLFQMYLEKASKCESQVQMPGCGMLVPDWRLVGELWEYCLGYWVGRMEGNRHILSAMGGGMLSDPCKMTPSTFVIYIKSILVVCFHLKGQQHSPFNGMGKHAC